MREKDRDKKPVNTGKDWRLIDGPKAPDVVKAIRPDDIVPFTRGDKAYAVRFRDMASQARAAYAPDEEDLTAVKGVGGMTLRLSDRGYDPTRFTGKGKTFLRLMRGMRDGTAITDLPSLEMVSNKLTQKDFVRDNVAYVIRNDHDLCGATITMPVGCALVFDGGTLNNGVIILDNTAIWGLIRLSDSGVEIAYDGTFLRGQVMSFVDKGYEASDGLYNNGAVGIDTPEVRFWDGSSWVKMSLDEEVTALQETAEETSATLEDTVSRITTVEETVSTLETVTSESSTTLTEVQERLTTDESDIDTLESRVDTVESTVSSIEENIDTVEADVSSLSDTVSGITSSLSNGYVVSAAYDSDSKSIYLYGSDGTVLSTIDATDFLTDGMINDVALSDTDADGNEGVYLHITFNTDAGLDDIYISVASLMSVLEGGDGITIDNTTVSAKLSSSSESYLTITSAGIAINGIDAIESRVTAAEEDIDDIEDDISAIKTDITELEGIATYVVYEATYSTGLKIGRICVGETWIVQYVPYATASQRGVMSPGNGLTVSAGVVSALMSPSSEEYMFIDDTGIGVTGIDDIVTRLAAVEDVVTYVEFTATYTSGLKIGRINVNDTWTSLYVPYATTSQKGVVSVSEGLAVSTGVLRVAKSSKSEDWLSIEADGVSVTGIDAIEERVTTAETDIDNLESRMDTAEGDVDSLESRMDVAEADIDSLEARMDVAEADIDDLQERTVTMETAWANTSYVANYDTGLATETVTIAGVETTGYVPYATTEQKGVISVSDGLAVSEGVLTVAKSASSEDWLSIEEDGVSVTGIDTIESRVTTAESDINSLETRMTTAETDIDNLEGRMDTAETDIDSLETRMDTAESDIDSLEGRMDTAEADIDSLETRMDTAEADIDSLEGRMDVAESDIDNLENRMDIAETDIDDLQGRMTTAESDIDSLEGRMDTAESGISSLGERMTSAEGNIEALDSRLDTAENDIDSLEERMDTAEGDIDSLESRMDTAETDIDNLEDDVDELGTNLTVFENVVAATYVASGSYNSTAQAIYLYSSSGTLLSAIDATAFIKDGMVSNVTISSTDSDGDSGTYLHIVFNTDAGKEDIYIDVLDMFTALEAGDGISITNGYIIAAVKSTTSEDWLTIDSTGISVTGIDALATRLTTAESDIDSLETQMDTAETDIDSLESRMTTAESDIDSLESRMDTTESDVDSLESRMDTAESDIDNLEVSVAQANEDINTINNSITVINASITSIESNIDDVESDIDDIEESISSIKTDISGIEQSITDLQGSSGSSYVASGIYDSAAGYIYLYASDGTTLVSLDTTDFTKDGMLDTASYVTTNADGDTGAYIKLTFNDDAEKDDIYVDLSGTIYTAGDGINIDSNVITAVRSTDSEDYLSITSSGIAVTGIDAIESRVTTAESDIDGLDTRVTTTETGIDNLENRMDTAESDIDSLEARVTTAESNITTIQSDITEIEGDITEINTNITVLETLSSSTYVATGSYNSTDKVIYLYSSSGTVLSTIDATAFIKDGMVSSVSVSDTDADGDSGKFLHITFNTDAGKDDIYLDITDILEALAAGNGISITDGNTISAVKSENSESYLTIDSTGIAVTGIDAIEARVTMNETSITSINNSVTSINESITSIENDITSIKSRTEALEASAVDVSYASAYKAGLALGVMTVNDEASTIYAPVAGDDQLGVIYAGNGVNVASDGELTVDVGYTSTTDDGIDIGTVDVGDESTTVSVQYVTDGHAGVMSAGDGLTVGDNGEVSVTYALSSVELDWIKDQVFDTYFTVTITRSASSTVFSGSSYTVTWTLTCKYGDDLVDLDSAPSGWTWSSTGVYTKTTTVTSSTGSSVSSGSATCTYSERSKTASSVSSTNIKYSYIVMSADETLTDIDDIADVGTRMSSTNTIAGDYTLTTEDGKYVFFVIANTSTLNSVLQLGLNYLSTDSSLSGYSLTRTDYGTYKIYRSANAMSAGSQNVTVA